MGGIIGPKNLLIYIFAVEMSGPVSEGAVRNPAILFAVEGTTYIGSCVLLENQ